MKTSPIGELLLSMGHVTQEQLAVALHTQRANPGYLGEILVGLDFVTADEIAHAIASQHDLPYVDLAVNLPQTVALEAIPKELALYNTVLPLRLDETGLTVVTHDPAQEALQETLQEAAGVAVGFVVSDKARIAQYVELYYYQLENPIEDRIAAQVDAAAAGGEISIEGFLEALIHNAIKDRATDIHIRPQAVASHVFYRIDGVLQHYYAFPSNIHRNVVSRAKVLANIDIVQQRVPRDGGFAFPYLRTLYDIRVALIPTPFGENLVLRILPKTESLSRLERLGFETPLVDGLEQALRQRAGIILMVGPSGGGKTTTMYSALRQINRLQRAVVTVEDPIELQLSLIQQTNVNEAVGYTFGESLPHLVRQDADVLLIGEIRDHATAQAVMRSALSGHLILSTITASDTQGAIVRLADLGIKSYLISSSLLAVLFQVLVRRLCDHCKRPLSITRRELQEHGFDKGALATLADERFTIYEPAGCEQCRQSGYLGRVAVAEMLEVDAEVRRAIDRGELSLNAEALLRRQGGGTIREDALGKLLQGVTSIAEILRVLP